MGPGSISGFPVELVEEVSDNALRSLFSKRDTGLATLKDGAKLFRFPSAAKCRQESAEVESPLIEEHGHGDESHAEFHARYRFRCDTPERLTHADVLFFEAFPSALELEVRTVTAKGQSARELTARRPRLHF